MASPLHHSTTTPMRSTMLLLLLSTALCVALAPSSVAASSGKVHVPLDHYFVYDGSTSDLVQHYYRRYMESDYIPPLEMFGSVPSTVDATLTQHGLVFDKLPGLLQRAVLWDAGYVLDLDGKPVRIHTRCGRSMAQISVPLKGYVRGGCIPRNCSTLNGDLFYRSFFCDGKQMGAASLCASENTELLGHSAMWADGAEPDDLPEPRVYRHHWSSDGESFLVFSIHTVSQGGEVAWEECPATASPIFPCVAYAKLTDTSEWCDPVPGKILGPWLHNYALDHRRTKYEYFLLVGVGVALLAVGVYRYASILKRRRLNDDANDNDASSSWRATEDDASYEPHDYLDTVAENEYTSFLHKSGIPETIHDDTEILSGRDEAALKTLQLFEVHPLIQYKRIAFKDLQLEKPLATGATGEVWLATLQPSGDSVAVKKLLPEKRSALSEMQLFASEVFVLAKLRHPHVVAFVGVTWTTLENIMLVMEYMDRGDLQSWLEKERPLQRADPVQARRGFTWYDQKLTAARSVASALQYLHSLSPTLIHRDVKSKNVLLASSPPTVGATKVGGELVASNKFKALDVKLADFGVSRRKYNFEEEETNLTMTGAVGTVSWTAPELLLGDDYSESIDVYSFGVLLTEIDTCELPYHDPASVELGLVLHPLRLMKLVIQEGRRPRLTPECPREIAALVSDCLQKDPSKRPTAADIVERLDVFQAAHHL